MNLGFYEPFGGSTREWSNLGFRRRALAYMSLIVDGMYWRLNGVLLHTCHSMWVACIGDLVVCSCIHVTRCEWHVLET